MQRSDHVTEPQAQRGQGAIPTVKDPESDGNVPAGAAPEAAPGEKLTANNKVLPAEQDPATMFSGFIEYAQHLALLERFLEACLELNTRWDENPNLCAGPAEQQILHTLSGFPKEELIEILAANSWMRTLIGRLNFAFSADQRKPVINLTHLRLVQLTQLTPDIPNALEVATSFVAMVMKNTKKGNLSQEEKNAFDHCKMIIELCATVKRPKNS